MYLKLKLDFNNPNRSLVQQVTDISNRVTSLDLSWNYLGMRCGVEQLIQLFSALPAISALDLGGNDLDNLGGLELARLFAVIPATITSLNLSWDLQKLSSAELVQAFAAIRARLTSLELRGNNLGGKSGDELAEAFGAMPARLSSLDLRGNNLGSKSVAELTQAFAAIRAAITSLSLEGNHLDNLSSVELANVLKAIPATITSLNLRENRLYKTRLDYVLAAISARITSLDLSDNYLYNRHVRLAEVFAAIPATVILLNLSDNGLGNKSVAELVQAFAAISTTSLNLSRNNLGSKTGAELAQVLGSIRPTVTSLDLSGNFLGRLSGAALKEALGGISEYVHTINLQGFGAISVENLKLLKDALPFVTTVVLDAADIERMSRDQLFHLAEMMPKAINVNVIDDKGNSFDSEKVKYLQRLVGRVSAYGLYICDRGLPRVLAECVNSFLSGASGNSRYTRRLNQHFDALQAKDLPILQSFFSSKPLNPSQSLDEKPVNNTNETLSSGPPPLKRMKK